MYSPVIAPAQLAGNGIRLHFNLSALRLEIRELIGHDVQVGCDFGEHGRAARDGLRSPKLLTIRFETRALHEVAVRGFSGGIRIVNCYNEAQDAPAA